jgi:RND family efflux transporter MFP subunit
MKRWISFPFLALVLVLTFWQAGKSQGQGVPGEPTKPAAESAQKSASPPAPPNAPKEPRQAQALPSVTTEPAQSGNLSKTIELTGSVAATRIARMASPGEGPVKDCKVREGDRLKRGEKVVSIGRNVGAEALVASSVAALKEQEQELRRVEQLVQSGAIAGSLLDTARSKYASARAQLAKSRETAEDYSITAPWDGIVSKVLVRDGDYVAPRTALVEIFDPQSLVVRFAVPEVQATEVRNEMAVETQLDAYPGKTFQGAIQRIYPELDMRMRTRSVEAVIGEPVALIPGMFARVKVILEFVPDAVTVPSQAVIVTPKGDRVAFVVQEGKALRRKVETGIEEGGRIQIVKGIQSGEPVIVAGNEKLKDGAEIQARQGDMP